MVCISDGQRVPFADNQHGDYRYWQLNSDGLAKALKNNKDIASMFGDSGQAGLDSQNQLQTLVLDAGRAPVAAMQHGQ